MARFLKPNVDPSSSACPPVAPKRVSRPAGKPGADTGPAAGSRERDRRGTDRTAQRADAQRMFHTMRELGPVDPQRQAIRRMLIDEYMPYARHLASRYDSGDVPAEDLHQVAYVGLVKAVDDYDPDYGVPFLGYAAPKILGELKRHFRDTTWPVHIPRRIKELSADVRPATETLRQRLKRDPTTAELAGLLGEEQSDVIEAIGVSRLRTLVSLDVPTDAGGESDLVLGDLIGAEDPGLLNVVDRETLRPLLAGLSVRERRILLMTFFQQMTQSQIGAELGVSQMHISRLLASTIGSLRRQAGCGEAC